MVKLVDTRDLKSLGQECPCRFDPGPRYKRVGSLTYWIEYLCGGIGRHAGLRNQCFTLVGSSPTGGT